MSRPRRNNETLAMMSGPRRIKVMLAFTIGKSMARPCLPAWSNPDKESTTRMMLLVDSRCVD
ncbi:hypothetical protein GOP47_0001726 [Adiantum capillus-veneris]|uniref:Uncharacterized protein n=1 Tax=Adiantum capillus-veneris TaxID=13818 RepID=A0A9D4ZNC5_ADICA|nr:hypothetical protein GOP47_0001726 [Adiantum capillus-veneris]